MIMWLERNRRSFEDKETTLEELKDFLPTQPNGVVSLLGFY